MALPSSGPISMNDMNTDRGIPSGTEISLSVAGSAYGVSYTTDGTNDLQFLEFYGKFVGSTTTTTTTTTAAPFYTYSLNATPGEPDGASACAAWALGTTTYYSAQSSITTGTSLYTTQAGIGNPLFAIPNGYRSNGTSYWNFISGSATGVGSICIPTTYYILDACDGVSEQITTNVVPPLTSQRYIDGISGIYYYYTNMTTTTPSSINTTIQVVSGQTGCPTAPTTTTTSTTTAGPTYNYYTLQLCGTTDESTVRTTTNLTNETVVKISGVCYTVLNNTAEPNTNNVVIDDTYINCATCNASTTTTTAAPETTTTTSTTTAAPTTTTTTSTTTAAPTTTTTTSTTTAGPTFNYYTLVLCGSGNPGDQSTVRTTTNLDNGNVVKISGVCYTVLNNTAEPNTFGVVIEETYNDCTTCNASTTTTTAAPETTTTTSTTTAAPTTTTTSTTTAAPTTTTTSTTTTTTTAAPETTTTTTTTTIAPTLSMTISQGCTGYLGTGYINITGVTGGSGNYTYHIGESIDFSNETAYNLNSSASGLSNGNYYVGVYDTTNNIYISEVRNISCEVAPTTTTSTTTAAPTTTTTTSTTTTTTTAAPETTTTTTTTAAPETTTTTTTTVGPTYYYNNAYRNTCGGENPCTDDGVVVVLRSTQPLSNLSWYSNGTKSYQPYESASGPSYDYLDIDIYFDTQADSCEGACNNYNNLV
jgi:hypothetical protein